MMMMMMINNNTTTTTTCTTTTTTNNNNNVHRYRLIYEICVHSGIVSSMQVKEAPSCLTTEIQAPPFLFKIIIFKSSRLAIHKRIKLDLNRQ